MEKDNYRYAIFLDASGTLLESSARNAIGVQLISDTKNILEAFKSRKINGIKIKTGIITNWGNRINPMLKALQIYNCFDVVISSDMVAKGKPDPGVFHKACSLVGIQFQNAIHIGDSLNDDALGAQNAGLQGIWIKRNDHQNSKISMLKHPVFQNLDDVLNYLIEKIIK